MAEAPDARALFDDLVDELLGRNGVEPLRGGSGFGRNSLKVNNKMFAMYVRDCLVVKLPATRVAGLVASGVGRPFDANKGIPMKEWLQLDVGQRAVWVDLAREAHTFVAD